MDACVEAGMHRVKVIHESEAAIINIAVQKDLNQNAMIVDFGGGKLDVSIYRIEDQGVSFISHSGDSKLGGGDIDNVVVKHLFEKL